jgi:hypothetical protein
MIEDIYEYMWFEEEEEEDITDDRKVYQSTWQQRVSCCRMDCH